MAMIRSDDIYISSAPNAITQSQLDLVELSQRKALHSANQFAPPHAKSMRKTTESSQPAPSFEFDSVEYAQKMAQARIRREQTSKGFNDAPTSPSKSTSKSLFRHDAPSSVDDGYASSECDTEVSGRETPRANIRLLTELDSLEKNSESGRSGRSSISLKVETRPQCALADIDEEEELQNLREQQEMMAKEAEIKLKYEQQLEQQRAEEQQMYMMRMEQLEMIRLQKAIAKESGKVFAATNTASKRPTTAPAKRPARYFGEHSPSTDGIELKATPSARPATAHGPRSTQPSSAFRDPAVATTTQEAARRPTRPQSAGWNPWRKSNNAVGPDEDDKPFTIIAPQPTAVEPDSPPARPIAWA